MLTSRFFLAPFRLLALACALLLSVSFNTVGDASSQAHVSGIEMQALDNTTPQVVAGMGEGGGLVRVLTTEGRVIAGSPFGGFTGGVRVATGDVNGDSVLDVIVGGGPGGGGVRVFSGVDATPLLNVAPFGPTYAGGVFVAAGDINGDGRDDLVVGAGTGGAVRLLSGVGGADLGTGSAFGGGYVGGVTVAAGDINGDGRADIITGMTLGGMVRTFDGASYAPMASGFPYGALHLGGVSVAAGDMNGDGRDDVVVSAMSGIAAARVFNVADARVLMTIPPFDGVNGMNVGAGDINNDGRADVIVGAGSGGGPHVRVFSGAAGNPVLFEAFAFDVAFGGGVFVAGPNRIPVRFSSAAATTFRTGDAGSFTVVTNGRGVTLGVVGTLPGGVTFTDRGDGTGVLSGTPAAGVGGVYALTIRALRGTVPAATQPFSLTVQQAPAFTSAASTAFIEQQAGTFGVTTTGFPTAALSISGALPTNVTFTDNGNGTATLSGTPPAGSAGVYPLTLSATNAAGTVTQNFSLTVNSAQPLFTNANTATFQVGTAATFAITTSATPQVTSITVAGTVPSGLTFTYNNDGTATLAGTPAAGTAGTHTFTFTATNGVGTPATQTFTLNVQQAPAFTSAASTTFTRNTPGTFIVTTTGVPTPAITMTGALPAGVTFTDNGNGTATLAGTPTATGTFALTFTAQNTVGSAATQTFSLTVQQAPAITSTAATTFTEEAAGTFAVTSTAFPTAALSVSGALPSGVTFTDNGNGTATFSGTPAPGTAGSYPLTISATNAVSTGTQNFSLTVHSARPLFTSANSATFRVGTAGTFSVTTSATPAVTSITVAGTVPSGLTLTNNGDGTATVAGTPAAGSAGTHTLTFTATNGVSSPATQTFTLNIQQVPAITSVSATQFMRDSPGAFWVYTTGFPSPAITFTGALPAGVTFTDNGNGTATIAGTPTVDGVFALTFTAQNGVGAAATQIFTLRVNGTARFTSAAATSFVVGAPNSFFVTAAGTPIVITLTLTSGALPNGVTFTPGGPTGILAGTPAAGTGGVYPLVFTAINAGAPVTQDFTLTINEAPAITSAASVTFNAGVANTFTVTSAGFPKPTLSQAGALPSGVTFTNNGNGTATLSGTPTARGTFPLTFSASNGIGTAATQNFTLTVSDITFTSANAVTFTVGTAGTFTVAATGTPAVTSISRTGGLLPTGVNFVDNGNGTATLSGNATPAFGGAYSFTFTANNGITSRTQTFTLTVLEAPTFTSGNAASFPIGMARTFIVTTIGFPKPSLTLGGVALPERRYVYG
jgi:hypothetical protein